MIEVVINVTLPWLMIDEKSRCFSSDPHTQAGKTGIYISIQLHFVGEGNSLSR